MVTYEKRLKSWILRKESYVAIIECTIRNLQEMIKLGRKNIKADIAYLRINLLDLRASRRELMYARKSLRRKILK